MLRRFSAPIPHRRRQPTRSFNTHSLYRSARVENESYFNRLPNRPNACPYAIVKALNDCAESSSLNAGEQRHADVIKLGLRSNIFINSALVDMYSKCNSTQDAHKLFDEMPLRNVVTWNSLIHGYSRSHFPIFALHLFVEMLAMGIYPSPFSISSVLLACSRLRVPRMGTMVHCFALRLGFSDSVVVGTALVDIYGKCSDMDGSRRVLDEMNVSNVVTWTSLVTGYAGNGNSDEAMSVVREMRRAGVGLNVMTYSSLLSSFSRFEDLNHGKQVHCLVTEEGLESDAYVSVALTTMYSRCGSSEDFNKILTIVPRQDRIAHNSVMAGFSHLGNGEGVLEQFIQMRRECVDVDHYTFSSLFKAIGILSALDEGRQTHALVFKNGYFSNACVQNGLVSMYSRCGSIVESKVVFFSMALPDLVSWNSLLSGCAQHGYGREAIELFEKMRGLGGVRPDNTTFLSVLSACSHAGFLDKGLEYFDLMKQEGDANTAPGMEHYSCMVDLLGRAGYLNEAESFVNSMPIKPGSSVYRSLLSACNVHGNVEVAVRAAECLLDLCPNDSATYVLLSNVFAERGSWDNAARVRKLMSERGVTKKPGWSWIEGY